MTDDELHFLSLGSGSHRRDIACAHRPGGAPGLFWLSGYNSEMRGNKAMTVLETGKQFDLSVTRFDFTAHGRSTGDFHQANISLWLEDALAVFEKYCSGPQIVVGSSMGGWIAMLLNRLLRQRGNNNVKAMVLVAPAIDMTRELLPRRLGAGKLEAPGTGGYVEVPDKYGGGTFIYTQNLMDDGEKHLLFGAPIETGCPIHILHGQRDPDVPFTLAQKLLQHMVFDDAQLTLIPDGDHRLSRRQDLELLKQALHRFF